MPINEELEGLKRYAIKLLSERKLTPELIDGLLDVVYSLGRYTASVEMLDDGGEKRKREARRELY